MAFVKDKPDLLVTAMWILTSYIFLLPYNAYAVVVIFHGIRELSDRVPSECLPIVTCCGEGVNEANQEFQ
eukprot:4618037-Karenia_brevis.AAC.1